MDYTKKKFELERSLTIWEKKAQKKNTRFYFLYLFFLIALAYVIDEIASNINAIMQNEVIDTFFGGSAGFSKYVIVATLCSGITIFSFIYRGLADKYGRKPFLFINTIGFGAGLFICFIANVLPVYIIGLLIVNFFAPCDIQVLYIIESSPSKHRGLFLTLGKAIGVLGVAIIPPLKSWAINFGWSYVFLIPACIAIGVGVLIFFFTKETDIFLKNKLITIKNEINFVENPASEYAKIVENKKEEVGIIEAVKYGLKHKEFIWLFIVGAVISICAIGCAYYPSILQPDTGKSLTDEQLSQALLIYPFMFAVVEVAVGILTDKLGRKTSILISGLCALMGFLLFIIAFKESYNPYIIGLYLGLFLGGYFAMIDIFNIVCSECSPTFLRASLLSLLSASLSLGNFLSTGTLLLARLVDPNLDLGFFCLIFIVPSLFFSLLIILTKVPDTKDKTELEVAQIVDIKEIKKSISEKNKDEPIKRNKTKKTK